MNELFEKASRLKLRFLTPKGVWMVEDLWDTTLTALDLIYKGLNKELKTTEEESLGATKTKADDELVLKISLIKYIYGVKQAESQAARLVIEKKAQKAKLMELIEKKKDENLSAKSIEELYAELNNL
jgi:uncharacterized protein (DUF2225 family)